MLDFKTPRNALLGVHLTLAIRMVDGNIMVLFLPNLGNNLCLGFMVSGAMSFTFNSKRGKD